MHTRSFSAALAALLLVAGGAFAAPVNVTGNVTPAVIFGSGNANGSFTGVRQGGVELALRGKLRYDSNGAPQNTFNYDGDHTYTFAAASGNAPANRSIWNFEWSINSDFDLNDGLGGSLDTFDYSMSIDVDPTAGVSATPFDPINVAFADHSIGTNATAAGQGVEASDANSYGTLIANNNVAQNSWNLGFFTGNPPAFNPQLPGLYTIELSALNNGASIASTSIDIKVFAPVPVPAALPLMVGALGLMGLVGWRRRAV